MSGTTVGAVCRFLDGLAPRELAESWDNVGLLAGDRERAVERLMTCLTITPDSVDEAVSERCDLIVTHHPLPFKPLARITTDDVVGRSLWRLIGAGISIYSAHTAFDSAQRGINQALAEGLGLVDVRPLNPAPLGVPGGGSSSSGSTSGPVGAVGSGRFGRCEPGETIGSLADRVKRFLAVDGLHLVGPVTRPVRQVAVGCGSGGSFLTAARKAGCDALVTGETNFHTCLEAEATGVALIMPGHYASERFGLERLASELSGEFPTVTVWASRREHDPLVWR